MAAVETADASGAAPIRGSAIAVLVGHPGIGDLVWHAPAIQAISRHHAKPVTLFAQPSTQAASLFAEEPAIGAVVAFERKQGREYVGAILDLTGALRRGRFQRIYILNRRPVLALASALAGIPERYGFGAPGQRLFLNRGGPLYDGDRVVGGGPIPHCRIFLGRNGIRLSDETPTLRGGERARATVRSRFSGMPRPWIALGATGNEEARRWPATQFAELARALTARWGGAIFLHGGPHHASQIHEVLEHVPGAPAQIVDLSRTHVPFSETMGLLAESDLFVGNDSGPLNVAAALGVPAFGLFGNAMPHESLSPRIRAILPATGVPDPISGMRRLTAAHVVEAIEGVLDARPAAPPA